MSDTAEQMELIDEEDMELVRGGREIAMDVGAGGDGGVEEEGEEDEDDAEEEDILTVVESLVKGFVVEKIRALRTEMARHRTLDERRHAATEKRMEELDSMLKKEESNRRTFVEAEMEKERRAARVRVEELEGRLFSAVADLKAGREGRSREVASLKDHCG